MMFMFMFMYDLLNIISIDSFPPSVLPPRAGEPPALFQLPDINFMFMFNYLILIIHCYFFAELPAAAEGGVEAFFLS